MASEMRTVFARVCRDIVSADANAVCLLADLSVQLFGVGAGSLESRIINLGIREQAMIGAAAGLAAAGFKPICHSFAPFLIERPFEQIKLDLDHQGLSAVLVSAGASFDIAAGGRSHQAPADVALMSTLGTAKVSVPGQVCEVEPILRQLMGMDGVNYLRLTSRAATVAVPPATFGETIRLKTGSRGVVLVVGGLVGAVLAATADLDVSVLYTTTVKPFNGELLCHELLSAKKEMLAIVEPYLQGTTRFAMGDVLDDHRVRVASFGVQRRELHHYGDPEQHEIAHGLGSSALRLQLTRFFDGV